VRKVIKTLLLAFRAVFWAVVATAALYALYTIATPFRAEDLPELKDGDIVFQSINTSQTLAIMVATHSVYSHVGIVEVTAEGPMVIEAVGPVRRVTLAHWVGQGIGDRIAIRRVDGLTEAQGKQVVKAAKALMGKPYDFYFFHDDEAIYCSELVYKAFARGPHMAVGKEEKIGDLSVDNFAVQKLIAQRWHNYPICKDAADYAACYARIMAQTLVSPESLNDDAKTKRIYSNYGLSF